MESTWIRALGILLLAVGLHSGAAHADDSKSTNSEPPPPPAIKPHEPEIPGRSGPTATAIPDAPPAKKAPADEVSKKEEVPEKKGTPEKDEAPPTQPSNPSGEIPSFPAPTVRSGDIPDIESADDIATQPGTPPGADVPGGFPATPAPRARTFAPPRSGKGDARREDVLVFHSGKSWKGYVAEERDDVVIFDRYTAGGGSARLTVPRTKIRTIRRGKRLLDSPAGSELLRDSWFLLRSDQGTIGTRHLMVIRVKTPRVDGYRLSETTYELPQGRHLPATETTTVEVVDRQFLPKLINYRERTVFKPGQESSERAFDRRVSGVVENGVWKKFSGVGGEMDRVDVKVPLDVRARLGHRENLLQQTPRTLGLSDKEVLDPHVEGLSEVRAGFVSISPRYRPGRRVKSYRGDEFHWEQDGTRLISWFFEDSRPLREEVAQGVFAVPATEAQCRVAMGEQGAVKGDQTSALTLPECGLGFGMPGPLWTWKPKLAPASHTGWRVLGTMKNTIHVADIRIEWHPESAALRRTAAEAEAWLLQRLRGLAPKLRVIAPRQRFSSLVSEGVSDAWRMEVAGRLRGESVHTIIVVVDRGPGRVIMLCACPSTVLQQARPALERFVATLRVL